MENAKGAQPPRGGGRTVTPIVCLGPSGSAAACFLAGVGSRFPGRPPPPANAALFRFRTVSSFVDTGKARRAAAA
jgi:hypothetical protein